MIVGINVVFVHLNRAKANALCDRGNFAGCFFHRNCRFAGIKVADFLWNPFRATGFDIHVDPVCVGISQNIALCILHFEITVSEKSFPAVCPGTDRDFFTKSWITVDDDLPGRKNPGISLFHHDFDTLSDRIGVESTAILKIVDNGWQCHIEVTVYLTESDAAFKLIHENRPP